MGAVARVRSVSAVALPLFLLLCPIPSQAPEAAQPSPPTSVEPDLLSRAYRELAIGLKRRAESARDTAGTDAGAGPLSGGAFSLTQPLELEAAEPDRLLFDTRPLGPQQAFAAPEHPSQEAERSLLALPLPPPVPDVTIPPAIAEASAGVPEGVPLPPERPDETAVASEDSASSPEVTSAIGAPEKARPRKAPRRREVRRTTPKPEVRRGATAPAPAPTSPPAEAPSPNGGSALQRASQSFTNALTCLFTPGCAGHNQATGNATGAVPQQLGSDPVRR
ncbi:hypothetical protein [Microvirga massiliensis]|uniref:hypothetical protein n=1 Tax=Microvirga massiliensis TaxID=1033741 RepID=UPI00062B5ACC|nr:hypothetical protein [Microvirga massiliensis]